MSFSCIFSAGIRQAGLFCSQADTALVCQTLAQLFKEICKTMYLACLTIFCLSIFAGNSIFCRAALVACDMGPLQYTGVRALSAALILAILCGIKVIKPLPQGEGNVWRDAWQQSSWTGALGLFMYMVCFSTGYVAMPSAPGTLILNMSVQVCMIGWGILHGVYPNKKQYIGYAIATAGLILLLSPGLTAPPLLHSLFMAGSGFAWGVFTVAGKDAKSAALATAGCFWRAALPGLFCVIAGFVFEAQPQSMAWIFVLAGGLASSLGYILWYAIVPRYTLINLSIIQLAIPVITAIQGFIFLEEEVTVRFVISTCLILGGIYQTIRTNHIHIRK
ncbi:MAG: DMT family transporter [Candidatus Desulfovibrio faecigallinarum]|nr:DMT family transporter [Candidatus Desulfovibrio faecigallinarum]